MSTCPLLCPRFLSANTHPARTPEPTHVDLRMRGVLWMCERVGWHDIAALLRALPASNEDFVFF